jgi:hypothetical protein
MFLGCSVYNGLEKWHKWLAQAELWYNTTYHSSLKCSSLKALYGYDPNVVFSPLAKERKAYNEMLRTNLLTAQNKFKCQAHKNRVDKVFQVGEQALLKLQPYTQK